MSVVIGIDPHKALHAACAVDQRETDLAEVVVRAGPARSMSWWPGRDRSMLEPGRSSPLVGSVAC
jgi:hypothetical protein